MNASSVHRVSAPIARELNCMFRAIWLDVFEHSISVINELSFRATQLVNCDIYTLDSLSVLGFLLISFVHLAWRRYSVTVFFSSFLIEQTNKRKRSTED